MDPASKPVKHTALGRFRHEGREMIVNKDGRVVVYSGDDAQFDYVYRFVPRRSTARATRRTTCACCRRDAVGGPLR
jgi:secreted PhoX family phosphatase